MNTPCHVNIFWDPTMGVSSHDFVAPAPVPLPPARMLSIEMIAMQMWTLGYLCGQNKFTTTVLHMGWPIVLDGHDIGMMIPDVTIPPTNLFYPITWPFSSRKITFASASVKMNGEAVGCSDPRIFLPMMTCGDPISRPTAVPLANWTHTLFVGLAPADIWFGVAKIATSVVTDLFFEVIAPPRGSFNPVMEFVEKVMPMDARAVAKKVVSSLTGAVISAVEGKPKLELKIGIPGVSEVGVTVVPGEATAGVDYFGGQDNALGLGPWAKRGVKRDKAGEHHLVREKGIGKPPPKKPTPKQ